MPLDRDSIGVMRSSLRPFPLPDQSQPAVVTLGQVRPGPRAQNEYVDSLRPQSIPPLKNVSLSVGGGGSPQTVPAHVRVCLPANRRTTLNTTQTIIATQPNSASSPPLKKDPIEEENHGDSIICANCGKCKCGACTEPRDLPSTWLCGDRCEVSALKAVECCTCFCCVKAVFYHCGQDEEANSCYEDPCACCGEDTPHCVRRWTCMAIMSLCLPCLWCYWPAKGCLRACTACYNRCRKKGCQCKRKPADGRTVSKHSQTRRLLIESDSSSA